MEGEDSKDNFGNSEEKRTPHTSQDQSLTQNEPEQSSTTKTTAEGSAVETPNTTNITSGRNNETGQPSGSSAQSARMGLSTQQKIIQTLALEGHDSMFAVSPKTWCEHLYDHVKPLPPGGINSTLPCESCGATQEAWVCLSCYHTYCGRYVQEHMVMHQDSSGHKIALSIADLSVWCYLCDSYLDNQILREALNSAHKSKFGCSIDGSTN